MMYYPELHLRHENGESISAVKLTTGFTEEFLEEIAETADNQDGKEFLKEQILNHLNCIDHEEMIDALIEDAMHRLQYKDSQ